MIINMLSTLRRLKTVDASRKSLPAEHLLTAGAGLWLLSSAKKKPSIISRTLTRSIGLALLARAASGRDGLARLRR